MKVNEKKTCDICGAVVAEKVGIFSWRTVKDYISCTSTEHVDDWFEPFTIRRQAHICHTCMDILGEAIK